MRIPVCIAPLSKIAPYITVRDNNIAFCVALKYSDYSETASQIMFNRIDLSIIDDVALVILEVHKKVRIRLFSIAITTLCPYFYSKSRGYIYRARWTYRAILFPGIPA
jgi:hypothetical protein